MNILYHFRTRGTGAEGVHVAGMVKAFRQQGHQVVLSSPTGIDPCASAGTDPFALAGKRGFWAWISRYSPGFVFELLEIGYNLSALLRNRRLLRAGHVDLIYERHAFFLFSTAWLARRRGIPLVVEVNELAGDLRVRKQPFFRRFAGWSDRFTFRRAALIITVSPYLQRRIQELGIAPEKIMVLPNGVEKEAYATPASGEEVRTALGLTGCTVIGFVGWLVPWHRLDWLVAVFASLVREHRELRLLIVGEGPLKPELAEAAAREGVTDAIIFCGAVPHDRIPAYIAAMDVAVVPHSNEYRSPIKLFEYMGQGKAVVAPRLEPVEMIITDGVNGRLFPPDDEATFRQVLEELIRNPEVRNRLGAQARLDVLGKHTWDRNAEAVLNHLRSPQETAARLQEVKAFHEQDAAGYLAARYEKPSITQYAYLVRREITVRMLAGTAGRILDVGCGPGPFIPVLRQADRQLVLADLSLNMVKTARAASEANPESLSFMVTDASRPALRTGVADAVIAIGIIGYIQEADRFFDELHRVLKPDGAAVIQTSNARGIKYRIYEEWLPALKGFFGRPQATGRGLKMKLKAYSRQSFNRLAERHGFNVTDWEYYDFHVPFLERISQRLAIRTAGWLQRYSRCRSLAWLASGYVMKIAKTEPTGPGASPLPSGTVHNGA